MLAVVRLSPCQGSQCSTTWLIPRSVGLHGLAQVVVVEEPVAERRADEGEPDPAGLSGEGEVFDVDVGHPRRSELNRVPRELKRRNTVRRVEADAEVR